LSNFVPLTNTLDQIRRVWNVPGIGVGVIQNGEIAWQEFQGEYFIGGGKKPDVNTIFNIASCTKAFTATLTAMLVDDGKISWDDRVIDYLPEFGRPDSQAKIQTNIRDLLGHRSDIPISSILRLHREGKDNGTILKLLSQLPAENRFRSSFNYQEFSYELVGEIIYRVTGRKLILLISERILIPLEMSRSGFEFDSQNSFSNRAYPHRTYSGSVYKSNVDDLIHFAAGGGLSSCLADLSNWVLFNLSNGSWKEKQLVSKEIFKELFTPQIKIDPIRDLYWKEYLQYFDKLEYGFGWFIGEYQAEKIILHGGNVDGMSSMVALLPSRSLGVISLANLKVPWAGLVLALTIIDLVLGKTRKNWLSLFTKYR
jgi:CubicO group peptidase (beta-lactamase class C family)